MAIGTMLLFYVVGALGAIAAAALWSAHRERRFGPTPSEDRIFRCERCGYVYTDDPDVDRARCSQCGALNEAIRF